MKIFICDDELLILKKISEKVKEILTDCTVTEFSDSFKLLEAIKKEECDLLLLDIDMPQISGLEVASQLNRLEYKPLLVFVTSHDELVYDSLMFHPFGFIRKNYLEEEIEKVLRDCEGELSFREKYFTFKSGSGNVRLRVSEITYLEGDGNYLKLYTKDRMYRIRDTIAAAQEALSEKGFIRFHRGFLVNQQAVKVLDTDEAELMTGERIPIGRNYAEEAKKQLMRYMLK
ncbi:MAG: LytTR family DNA-binding domain-containing protein [Bacillota bacterium]|nr:LytTR family DNA-binding domain-containing protein [Bacillota bacterium]